MPLISLQFCSKHKQPKMVNLCLPKSESKISSSLSMSEITENSEAVEEKEFKKIECSTHLRMCKEDLRWCRSKRVRPNRADVMTSTVQLIQGDILQCEADSKEKCLS
eukprot:752524-Hanusia_phi.AAC.9